MPPVATLYLMCGKMGAGKSTLARRLAADHRALLLCEDELLGQLYPGEITDLASYLKYSSRLKAALCSPIQQSLAAGASIVLDFPGNTIGQRAWFRKILDPIAVAHELHFVDTPDAICKQQLGQRNAGKSETIAMQDGATFDLLLAYFVAPTPEEEFVVIHHRH